MVMIYLSDRANFMIRYAAEEAKPKEIMGMGKCLIDSDEDVMISDILIPKQEVGGAHADFEGDDLANLMIQLADREETLADWRCWWHSHVGMSPTPSPTDVDTLWGLAKELDSWAVGVIIGSNGTSYHGWINTINPLPMTMTLKVDTLIPESEAIREEVRKVIKENVTEKTYKAFTPGAKQAVIDFPTHTPSTDNGKDGVFSISQWIRENITLAYKRGSELTVADKDQLERSMGEEEAFFLIVLAEHPDHKDKSIAQLLKNDQFHTIHFAEEFVVSCSDCTEESQLGAALTFH